MKKLATLVLLLLSIGTKAQETFTTYSSEYFNKKYNIDISSTKKKDVNRFWIDCASADNTSKEVNFLLYSSDIPSFLTFVDSLRNTYVKWVKTAMENNVKDLTKDLKFSFSKGTAAFSYGDWQFDNNVKLTARFKVIDEKHLLIVESGELQSGSNQFMKSKGLYIVFSSKQEFDQFLKSFDLVKAAAFINGKNNKEDLFN